MRVLHLPGVVLLHFAQELGKQMSGACWGMSVTDAHWVTKIVSAAP